jgi:hypothetical protein
MHKIEVLSMKRACALPLFFMIVVMMCGQGEERLRKEDTEPGSEGKRAAVFAEPAIAFNPRAYTCYRISRAPEIDGRMEEKVWGKIPWTEEFTDIEGDVRPAPRFRTRVKMAWDDRYFYIAAQLEEPHVWARLTQRDTIIFYDNDFEIFIDPDGDTYRYYEVEINALGTVWDLCLDRPYRDGGSPLFYWDIRGMKIGVDIQGTLNDPADTDRGWTLETALPWEVLKEWAPEGRPPRPGEYWRVNFSRVEWDTEIRDGRYVKRTDPETGKPLPEHNWVWSPQGLINMHYPEMWGFVRFSGSGPDRQAEPFTIPQEEEVKWLLRRVYYRQMTHFLQSGRFSDSWKALGIESPVLDGYVWPPAVQASRMGFEARIAGESGAFRWVITEDGRVEKQTQ